MIHDLKILPIYFEAVALGIKTFEVRKDDRPYQVGDTLLLCEYGNGEFTGKKLKAKVTYILRDSAFCKDGYCIMGIKEADRNKYISRADVKAICHDIYLRSDEWTNEGITAIDTADEILERVDEKIKEKESENNFNDTDIDADVQPIVYAHKTINVGRRSYCSNCGKLAIMEDFCSKCGAKVKDGEQNG